MCGKNWVAGSFNKVAAPETSFQITWQYAAQGELIRPRSFVVWRPPARKWLTERAAAANI